MASANVVNPSPTHQIAPFDNISPEASASSPGDMPQSQLALSDEDSALSDAADVPPPSAPSSPSPPIHNSSRSITNTEEGDVNASEDADYEEDITVSVARPAVDSDADSDSSPRPAKRKANVLDDEEQYIRENPELYGIRRSHRARPTRQIVDESSDAASDSDVVPKRPRKRLRQAPSRQSSKRASPEFDSDHDSDAYGARKSKLTKKRRRNLQPADNLAPTHAEIRFSTRRAGKVSNYNEDDDDMFDEDLDDMTPNYWVGEEEDTRPQIGAVLNHRLRPEVTSSPPARGDYEYLVKWEGQAYYHATWETNDTLSTCRSFRKVDNYIKKILLDDHRIRCDPSVPPEEKEKHILDREQFIESLDDFKKVERVIGWREGEETDEYYIKWKGLPYNEATWESSSLISDIAQVQIDKFLKRSSDIPVSDKTELNLATRSIHRTIAEQPDYIQGGKLRDFQMTGLNFLAFNWSKGKNVVLADEMGLGKTVQTVAFMNWLRHARGQQGPFIVVVPLSTMPAWGDTFDFWAPDINYVVYNGKQEARDIIKDYELLIDGNPRRPRFHVLLTTYEYVLADSQFLNQIKWQFMAVDEAHRLKNRESQLYDRLLEFKTPSRLLITGTPVQNNLGELSALFDFLMPGIIDIDENMDLASEAASLKITELTKAITPYMLRRTKQKVESDLPPKSEKIIRVELSDIQLEYYKNILTKNYTALNQGTKGQRQSLLNIMMELKKASNHPFMFPAAEDRLAPEGSRRDERLRALITSSGKMMLLDQLLTRLKRDGHRVLIFSQMVKMLDFLGEYMEARGHAFQRLDGTISSSARRVAIDHFNAPDSADFCFLLSTRAGGLGINLMTADTVIIFDSDWNPQADLQAMARAHRIGQQKPVSVYRLVSKETIEEEILERARNKLMLEFLTIQRGVTDKETQARRAAQVGEPGSSTEISRILKKRGQKMFEQTDNQKKLEELDLDAVLEKAEDYKVEQPDGTDADGGEEFLRSFDFVDVKVDELSWDEIIPREKLEEIKADEEKRKNEEYLNQVIEQNRPRKRAAAPHEDREERKAKRQARIQVAESSSEDEKADPKRPLNEREIRYLLKGYLRYGGIHDRTEEFLTESRLKNRDFEVVKATMQEILDRSAHLVKKSQEQSATLEKNNDRTLTKKDKKAILFELRGVKRINAETILERPGEMKLLREVTSAVPDPKNFRIPEATKGAGYTCDWSHREDGMLCVGVARHGYGAWEKIRDDTDLGLGDKFFLEEHRVGTKAEREKQGNENAKSPGAVHLVRRIDYLISVLKTKYTNDPIAKKAVENHHRNNKKNSVGGKHESSPASSSSHRKPLHDKHRQRAVSHANRNSLERSRTPDTRIKSEENRKHRSEEKKHRPDSSHHRPDSNGYLTNGTTSQGSDNSIERRLFGEVMDSLHEIKAATQANIPDNGDRATTLRKHLEIVGNHIRTLLATDTTGFPGLENRLWLFVSKYWPNKGIKAENIENIYSKIAARNDKEHVDKGKVPSSTSSRKRTAPNGTA